MKRLAIVFIFFIVCATLFAQTNDKFNYQAVLHDSEGIMADENVTIIFSILKSDLLTVVFEETHNITTNNLGLVNLNIGSIEDLTIVDWKLDNYYLRISVNGNIIGINEILSVPYALHSKTVESVDETDPVFIESVANGITESDTSNWNNKLEDYTETDPTWNGEAGSSGNIGRTGYVGIGTDNPTANLDVVGLLKLNPMDMPVGCEQNKKGSIYYDSVLTTICVCNGTHWIKLDGSGYCECVDKDEDGFDTCDPDHTYDTDGLPIDLDDNDPNTYPEALEVCNGKDNNCDGLIDNDAVDAITYYKDYDGDGYGNPDIYIISCIPYTTYVTQALDCNDSNENINPDAIEVCDGFDNDCNGLTDEYWEELGEICVAGMGECMNIGMFICNEGDPGGPVICSASPDPGPYYEPIEVSCDGIDNDCDGLIDNNLNAPLANLQHGVCIGARKICAGEDGWQEPDYDAIIYDYESVESYCDNQDNDCDGDTDETCQCEDGETRSCVSGAVGSCSYGIQTCEKGYWGECMSSLPVDELCDYMDNDCDGEIDEDFKDGNGNYSSDHACGNCFIDCTAIFNYDHAYGACYSLGDYPVCAMVCYDGYYNCDGIIDNGCESTNPCSK